MKKILAGSMAVIFIMTMVILSSGTVNAKGSYNECVNSCDRDYNRCMDNQRKAPKNLRDPIKCINQKDACVNKCIKEWDRKDKDVPTGK
ncbi:MAG TPA: hypothetical protein PLR60_11205 [Syntrophorhabdaceae bacterium]|nr:hypothetical protein [Syntrophorhabdaceae bacterium]